MPKSVVELTAEKINRLEIIAGAYKSKKYHLTGTDCVTFVADAAQAVGLNVPDRDKLFAEWKKQLTGELKKDVSERQAQDTFPEFFVRRLAESNGQAKGAREE